jgi:hypothetical protein
VADEIVVIGIPEVAGALERYPAIAKPEFQQATDAALLGMVPELASYPPQKSWQHNRRTGNLGRMWTAARPEWQAMASGFEGTLGNATGYAEWVQGEKQTLAAEVIGWKPAEKLLQAAKGRIEALYQAAAKRIADAINKVTM